MGTNIFVVLLFLVVICRNCSCCGGKKKEEEEGKNKALTDLHAIAPAKDNGAAITNGTNRLAAAAGKMGGAIVIEMAPEAQRALASPGDAKPPPPPAAPEETSPD